jgi:hypothetical protein
MLLWCSMWCSKQHDHQVHQFTSVKCICSTIWFEHVPATILLRVWPRVLHVAVVCLSPPAQPSDALPWSNCKPALNSICTARCASDAKAQGYRAVCVRTDSTPAWQVTGGCGAGENNKVLVYRCLKCTLEVWRGADVLITLSFFCVNKCNTTTQRKGRTKCKARSKYG